MENQFIYSLDGSKELLWLVVDGKKVEYYNYPDIPEEFKEKFMRNLNNRLNSSDCKLVSYARDYMKNRMKDNVRVKRSGDIIVDSVVRKMDLSSVLKSSIQFNDNSDEIKKDCLEVLYDKNNTLVINLNCLSEDKKGYQNGVTVKFEGMPTRVSKSFTGVLKQISEHEWYTKCIARIRSAMQDNHQEIASENMNKVLYYLKIMQKDFMKEPGKWVERAYYKGEDWTFNRRMQIGEKKQPSQEKVFPSYTEAKFYLLNSFITDLENYRNAIPDNGKQASNDFLDTLSAEASYPRYKLKGNIDNKDFLISADISQPRLMQRKIEYSFDKKDKGHEMVR